MFEFKNYNGLLYVGDPHLWSKGPGKRLDRDIFSDTVLNKIEQAVNIAIKNKLYLIFLGDLFHVHTENNISMLTKLIRILNKLPEPPATVEGNHEKSQTKLSDDVALTMLREANIIRTMEKSQIWGHFVFSDNSEAYVGATPYGEKLPTQINSPKEGAKIIWLSHHDLDFGETYPGAILIKEIKGVDMLINGHIHKTKKSLQFGNMTAHNPGNITRLSTDCAEHVPAVWQWKPEQNNNLEPIDLVYEKNIFDMTGKQIEVEISPMMIAEEITPQQTSLFVEKMNQQAQDFDPIKTDDGAYLKDNVIALGKAMQIENSFTSEIIALIEEALSAEDKK